MANYYVQNSLNANNKHEIHRSSCFLFQMQKYKDFNYLGSFNSGGQALSAAKISGFPNSCCCRHCLSGLHTEV